ncbi:8425_t:CDS:2 [Rhizophagus irregularis]|nr:8425_t:CDS:2 [Rhizophagus irregularis]
MVSLETRENVIVEDLGSPPITSTQNETNISNPFYNLIEKQAKEFEEFGKRMSLDLQNTYREYLIQQTDIIKENTNPVETENVCNKHDEIIDSQSQLIDSLRARVEILETDHLIKEQDFRKLRNEFNDFKKEIQSILSISTATAATSSAAQDNKENSSLYTNENVVKDSDITPIQSEEPLKFVYDEEEISDYKNVDKENIKPNQPYSDGHEKQLYSDDQDHDKEIFAKSQAAYQNHLKAEFETPYPYQENEEEAVEFETSFHYTDNYEDETSYQYVPSYDNYGYDNYDSTYLPSSSYQQYNNDDAYQNGYDSTYLGSSTSYQRFNDVEEILNNLNNRRILDHTFKPLRQTFNINQLLKYEKSDLFNPLSSKTKSSIRTSINDELRDELSGKKKMTQPISVYVNRNIVPSLPPGIKSYTEFGRTSQYNRLSSEKKKRIQKIISKEKIC